MMIYVYAWKINYVDKCNYTRSDFDFIRSVAFNFVYK